MLLVQKIVWLFKRTCISLIITHSSEFVVSYDNVRNWKKKFRRSGIMSQEGQFAYVSTELYRKNISAMSVHKKPNFSVKLCPRLIEGTWSNLG